MPQRCSSILYSNKMNPAMDITLSFTYNFYTSGIASTTNYGFGVFFTTGTTATLQGGGAGVGLGMVSSSIATSLSCINGIFLGIGFDNYGDFCRQGAAPYLPTGIGSQTIHSITVRKDYSNLNFLSCIVPTLCSIFVPDTEQTIRINIRKMFTQIDVFTLSGNDYTKIATFDTLINPKTLPPSVKLGISYAGDTLFYIKNPTINFTAG